MATNDQTRLSIRAYARRCSSSHVAVKKAIDKGLIRDGWDKVSEMIIVALADEEWGKTFMLKKGVVPVDHSTEKEREQADKVNRQSEQWQEAKTEFEKKVIKQAEAAASDSGEKWNGGDIPNNVSFQEALRIERILASKLKQMQTEELEGLLVRKAEINKQMQVAGIEIRKQIERFPMAIIDKVLSAKGRTESLRAMELGVHELLEQLVFRIEKVIGESITDINDGTTPEL